MQQIQPEGYRKLLAYQKAQELHTATLLVTSQFPKTKTFYDLADQMDRSARSGNKNIVEGWKRNTTKEYFDFLGFSIGAVEELKDDSADVATGVYPQLMGIRGVMGGIEKGERGGRGEKGNLLNPLAPLYPFDPNPFFPLPCSRSELDKLKFYPLDQNLPPIVQIFLRAKEVNFLLYKLQQSLDLKMDNEHTKPLGDKIRQRFADDKKADDEFQKQLDKLGLKRLSNGRYVDPTDPDYPK